MTPADAERWNAAVDHLIDELMGIDLPEPGKAGAHAAILGAIAGTLAAESSNPDGFLAGVSNIAAKVVKATQQASPAAARRH